MPKESLTEQPISLPGSPFWNIFKRFGRDEMIALVINVIATVLVGTIVRIPLVLALTGPIVEKVGFFIAHFNEAYNVYSTTPEKQRKKISYYSKKAIKNGSTSLIEDILIHDPIYILFMFTGILIYPACPIWILALLSFIIAVLLVVVLQTPATAQAEGCYWLCINGEWVLVSNGLCLPPMKPMA